MMNSNHYGRIIFMALLELSIMACAMPEKNNTTSSLQENQKRPRRAAVQPPQPQHLTLQEIQKLLRNTLWEATTSGPFTENYRFLSETKWQHKYSDVELHEATIENWELIFDEITGKPLLYIEVGPTCLSQLLYFPDATPTSLGNRFYKGPATDSEGYVEEGSGQLFEKTGSAV